MLLLFIYVGFMFITATGLWDFGGQIQTPGGEGLADLPTNKDILILGATGSLVGIGMGALGAKLLGESILDVGALTVFSALTWGIWNITNGFIATFDIILGNIGVFGRIILFVGFLILYTFGMVQLRTGGFESAS